MSTGSRIPTEQVSRCGLPERPTARTDVYVYICICIPEPVGYLRCIPEILVYINFALASRLGRIVSNIIGTHLTLPLHPPSFSLFAKYPPLQRQESHWADPQNPMACAEKCTRRIVDAHLPRARNPADSSALPSRNCRCSRRPKGFWDRGYAVARCMDIRKQWRLIDGIVDEREKFIYALVSTLLSRLPASPGSLVLIHSIILYMYCYNRIK